MATLPHFKPETAGCRSSQYSDDEIAFANDILCPRYAENDPTSAPPSPASIESFDVLESIPWRRSYVGLDGSANIRQSQQLRTRRRRVMILSSLVAVLVLGCGIGGYLAIRQKNDEFRKT
jgi:hypothetical protein